MKRARLILSLIFTVAAAYPQKFIGSVIAGGNISQVDGDMVAGYCKMGFNGGMSVTLPLDDKYHWYGTIELLFSQKGSYESVKRHGYFVSDTNHLVLQNEDYSVPFNRKIKYKLNLDYVEVPVVFHYEDHHTGCAIGAGFAWGRLVRAHEIENGWTTTTDVRSKTYRTSDWSVIADAQIRLYKGLKLNVRFQYSLRSLRTRDYYDKIKEESWTRKEYNNVISVRLIYSFNESFIRNSEWVPGGRKGPRWVHDTSKGWYTGN